MDDLNELAILRYANGTNRLAVVSRDRTDKNRITTTKVEGLHRVETNFDLTDEAIPVYKEVE